MINSSLDIRATTYLRNEKMIVAREHLKLSQKAVSDGAGVSFTTYCRLEKLDYPAKDIENDVLKISAFLCISPDDILPPGMEGIAIPNKHIQVKEFEISCLLDYIERQSRLYLPSPSDVVEQNENAFVIKKFLKYLSFRESEIIKLRYGFNDGYVYTPEEVGKIFKVTRERIRQVEAKAIRKLRNYYKIASLNKKIRELKNCD